jgi:hypothetical protein
MTEQPMVSPWSALVVTIVPLRDGRQQLHSSDVRHHDLGKPEISPLTKLWKDPPCYQWVNKQTKSPIFNSYVTNYQRQDAYLSI